MTWQNSLSALEAISTDIAKARKALFGFKSARAFHTDLIPPSSSKPAFCLCCFMASNYGFSTQPASNSVSIVQQWKILEATLSTNVVDQCLISPDNGLIIIVRNNFSKKIMRYCCPLQCLIPQCTLQFKSLSLSPGGKSWTMPLSIVQREQDVPSQSSLLSNLGREYLSPMQI